MSHCHQVHARSNYSDALFVADFPGLHLENYISEQLENVTLTVLSGRVVLELNPPLRGAPTAPHVRRTNLTLLEGESAAVPSRVFHRVHTVSDSPACYMYAYTNLKRMREDRQQQPAELDDKKTLLGAILGAILARGRAARRAVSLVSSALLNILYSVPMVQTVRLG